MTSPAKASPVPALHRSVVRSRWWPTLLLSCSCLFTGCVERYFRVETDPPDADVYVNGSYLGRSPVEQPFTYYGTFRVDVHHSPDRHPEPYAPWTGLVEVERPWFQYPIMDLFAELIDPRTHVDRHVHQVTLEALPPPGTATEPRAAETEALRSRAELIRKQAR